VQLCEREINVIHEMQRGRMVMWQGGLRQRHWSVCAVCSSGRSCSKGREGLSVLTVVFLSFVFRFTLLWTI